MPYIYTEGRILDMKNTYKNLEEQYKKLFRHIKLGSFKTRERYGKAFKRFMLYVATEYKLQKLAKERLFYCLDCCLSHDG